MNNIILTDEDKDILKDRYLRLREDTWGTQPPEEHVLFGVLVRGMAERKGVDALEMESVIKQYALENNL